MKAAIAAALCCLAAAPVVATLPSEAKPPRFPVPTVKGVQGLGQYAQSSGKAEGFTPYVPQTSCDPRWRKGIAKFRDLVLKTYPATSD